MTVFFPREENFIKAILFVSLTAPLICIFSALTWAGFGSTIRIFIANKKVKKFIEIVMNLADDVGYDKDEEIIKDFLKYKSFIKLKSINSYFHLTSYSIRAASSLYH